MRHTFLIFTNYKPVLCNNGYKLFTSSRTSRHPQERANQLQNVIKEILLKIGFIEEKRTTWGNIEIPQTFFLNYPIYENTI